MESTGPRTRSRKSMPIKNNNTVLAYKQKNGQNNKRNSVRSDNCTLPPVRRNRNSTPVRNSLKRNRHDSSTLIELPKGSVRNFHPSYDPNIEIRQAKERYEMYQSDDWNKEFELEENTKKDLAKYQNKRLRKSLVEVDKEQFELEKKTSELRRRQKDVDLGKITQQYAKYVFEVPKPDRAYYHPKTPNKFRKMSRRAWDGLVKKWRKHLHNYNDADFSIMYKSDCSSTNISQSTEFSFCIEDELPECKSDFKFDELNLDKARDVIPEYDEEETLQGNQNNENVVPSTKRPLKYKSPKKTLPSELIHCGLTSDIDNFKMIKENSLINSENVQSPSKKARREVLGILAQNNKLLVK